MPFAQWTPGDVRQWLETVAKTSPAWRDFASFEALKERDGSELASWTKEDFKRILPPDLGKILFYSVRGMVNEGKGT